MSSFPKHVENIRALEKMGFDVSEAIEDNEVTMDSWGYDKLVYMIGDVIDALNNQKFKVDLNKEVKR